jgi:hypothetical protein
MKVEVLYFDGCPTYEAAEKTLRDVFANKGMEADVELVAVNTDEEARRLRFPGSPTIRVAGKDLFPTEEREDWRLGCRVYTAPEGLRGSPTVEMFEEALTKIGAAGADGDLWGRGTRAASRRGSARGCAAARGVQGRASSRSHQHPSQGA